MVHKISITIAAEDQIAALSSQTVEPELLVKIKGMLQENIGCFKRSFYAWITVDEERKIITGTIDGEDFRYERPCNGLSVVEVVSTVLSLGAHLKRVYGGYESENEEEDEEELLLDLFDDIPVKEDVSEESNSKSVIRCVKFHFPTSWVQNVLEQYSDFWEEFTKCILTHHDATCGVYKDGYMTADIPETVYEQTMKNTANTMTSKYGMANIWDMIIVQERKLVHFSIRPERLCEDEILRKEPDFFSKFSNEVKKMEGVKIAYYFENEINVSVLEENVTDLLNFIERFLLDACEIDDPYNVLKLAVDDEVTKVKVEKYIQSYNARTVEELFAELEQRLLKQNEAEQQKPDKENSVKNVVENEKSEKSTNRVGARIGFEYPVKFSPEMMNYIKELRQVTQALDRINNLPQFYTKSLLISMDDGWGYSAFLKVIRDELLPFYHADADDVDVEEVMISESDGLERWLAVPKAIKTKAGRVAQRRNFSIAAFDIRDWMTEIGKLELLDCLRKIGQYSTNILCVFRIPYMDVKVVRNIEEQMSSVLSLRTIIVPPVSTENMVTYLKNKICESRFMIDEACDDWLEQWICQEKNDGNFFGYKTLDKMAGELIYHKALHNDGYGVLTYIEPKDIMPMLTEQFMAEDAYELLEGLIGITQVKTKVREIVAQIKLQKALAEQGKAVEKPSIHMMFTGNPGTGKTTVARIIGRILKQEGILRKGQFFEKQGNDFVGKYIGHSAPLVRASCRDAYGSVLFIDEAYGMAVEGTKWNSGAEVIATFIAEMENHRDDLCVIMAGYTDEMQEFMKVNSGLESRIPHIIEFPNYTREELIQIFFKMVDGNFEYEEALKDTLTEYINGIPEENFDTKEFSNGRFVRNLYEHLWGKAAYRISLSGEPEIVLKKEDMVSVIAEESISAMIEEKSKNKIGFRP